MDQFDESRLAALAGGGGSFPDPVADAGCSSLLAAAATAQGTIFVGLTIMLHGLSSAGLNYQEGRVVSVDMAKFRAEVLLCSGSRVAVKLKNVVVGITGQEHSRQ